jgi:two-component system, CitB family, sensor kinase
MSHLQLRRLSTQIAVAQLAILTATVVIGFLLFAHRERGQLDHQYEERAASIAQAVSVVPDIVDCLSGGGALCREPIQNVATRVQRTTGSSYIVVIDMQRVRHSHPIPGLIGKKVAEPIATLDGRTHIIIDHGSTGTSANGKAPIYATDGRMIGEVSAGIRESSVSAALWKELPAYAGWFGIALAAGVGASLLLARRLKRRTFGLELDEIASLLQEREATLHGIREGVIAFDEADRISVINDEARRLLGGGSAAVGGTLDELVPPGRLRDVLSGEILGQDEVVLTDDHCLTVNRMPVVLAGRPHGTVVTLRDRTEMSGLLRELDGVRSLSDSLRAQHHEFANRMHTVAGLIELGHLDDALSYLTELRGSAATLADSIPARIASPLIVGLLLGKAAEASERGVVLEITEDTWLGDAPDNVQALTTILGNLIDNAFDALVGARAPGRVVVSVIEDADVITVKVSDDGPGIPAGSSQLVFVDGYTTKTARGSIHRGIGLALVARIVHRLNGSIQVSDGPGAEFVVSLPRAVRPGPLVIEGAVR